MTAVWAKHGTLHDMDLQRVKADMVSVLLASSETEKVAQSGNALRISDLAPGAIISVCYMRRLTGCAVLQAAPLAQSGCIYPH